MTLLGIDCLDVQRLVEASRICQKDFIFGKVKLLTSQKSKDKNIINIPHLSYEGISRFLIKDLHKFFDTSHVLIFQYDGFILNPTAWSDSFLKYDYIGAPWWYDDYQNVGNGGFSLRSKRLCEILANDERVNKFHPEDLMIGRLFRPVLEKHGILFAPECVARRFSFEGGPRVGTKWNGSFGFHHFTKTNLDDWPIFKNANIFTDYQFIFRLLKRQRERLQKKVRKERLQEITGKYITTNKQVFCKVDGSSGKHLLLVRNGKRTIFFPYDEFHYFSDETNEILEFEKRQKHELLLIYQKNNGPTHRAMFLRKVEATKD